jgi:GntR family transcriptional repressor for pyruvate dehydrogenase complex
MDTYSLLQGKGALTEILGPVKKVNLTDEIFNRILNLIKEGYFKPNEKLMSEREFCIHFQVSRTSVREAIKGLTSLGIAEKRRDGTYVCNKLTDILVRPMYILLNSYALSLDEVFEARIAVETQIARMAAIHAKDEDILALEGTLKLAEQASEDDVMKHSVNFHRILAASTHNHIMQDMYTVIYSVLQKMRSNQSSLRQARYSQNLHSDILHAIKNRDPDKAEQEMKIHLSTLKMSIQ